MRVAAIRALCALALLGLLACEGGPRVSIPYEVVGLLEEERGRQGFVVVELEGVADRRARSELTRLGRELCRGATLCNVHFWDNARLAARTLPIGDIQAKAKIAAYNRNLRYDTDGLTCHPFGAPEEACPD